jgi:diacylglycerol kinase
VPHHLSALREPFTSGLGACTFSYLPMVFMMMSAFAASNSAIETACDLSMNSAIDSYGRLYRVAQTGFRFEY